VDTVIGIQAEINVEARRTEAVRKEFSYLFGDAVLYWLKHFF